MENVSKYLSIVFIGIGSFFFSPSFATEVDSFTQRYDPLLQDSLHKLNKVTVQFLQEGLDKANKAHIDEVQKFYKFIYKYIGGSVFWGRLEVLLMQPGMLDKRDIAVKESIYGDISFSQGFALHLASLGSTIKVGKFYIGTDKIGHFMEEGYRYYQVAYVQGKGLSETLKIGDKEERGIYGLATTGVYSYGDLNANFMGTFFWLMFAPTEFNQGYDTYVIRENGEWILNPRKQFDWRNYINAGMDEGLNCNTYKTKSFTNKVNKRLNIIQKIDTDNKYSCPVNPDLCENFVNNFSFPEFAESLISKECLAAAK